MSNHLSEGGFGKPYMPASLLGTSSRRGSWGRGLEWWNYENVKRYVNPDFQDEAWQTTFSLAIGWKHFTFLGSLVGRLNQTLVGLVQEESRQAIWRLKPVFQKDHYLGTHTEINEDSEDETGSIWLYPKTG